MGRRTPIMDRRGPIGGRRAPMLGRRAAIVGRRAPIRGGRAPGGARRAPPIGSFSVYFISEIAGTRWRGWRRWLHSLGLTYVVRLAAAGRCDFLATVVAEVTAVAATALTAMYTLNVTLHTGVS